MNSLAQNPRSTAKGLFGFINATAKALGLKNPFDPTESFVAAKKLTAENTKRFGNDPADLYHAVYLGATLFNKVIEGKALTPKETAIYEDSLIALRHFKANYQKVKLG